MSLYFRLYFYYFEVVILMATRLIERLVLIISFKGSVCRVHAKHNKIDKIGRDCGADWQ